MPAVYLHLIKSKPALTLYPPLLFLPTFAEILYHLMHPSTESPKSRPPLDDFDFCEEYIVKCMADCWREEATERPEFKVVRQRLGPLQAGL